MLALDGFHGILAFSLPEALWLADQGVTDDIVVAYPATDRAALARLASYPAAASAITLMVDSPDHLDLIEKAAAAVPGPAPVQVCMDIDTSYYGLGGLLRAGARRSPVRTPADAAALARDIAARPALRLAGLMAYEAQIAGVGDKPAGRPLYGLARPPDAAPVRGRTGGAPRGHRQRGARGDPTAFRQRGRHRVDRGHRGRARRYRDRRGLRAVPAHPVRQLPGVLRPPGRAVRAARGAPARARCGHRVGRRVRGLRPGPASRLPARYLPAGLRLDRDEGAGEVQTPLLGPAADGLRIGDRVWMRHAKAGELCERFNELHLVDGDAVIETVPTYRGEGQAFG